MAEKQCFRCGEVKSTDLFYKNKTTKDGLQRACKDCSKWYYSQRDKEENRQYWRDWSKGNPRHKERIAAYRKNNPEMQLGIGLVPYWPGKTWKEALAEYRRLLLAQDNKCAICKRFEAKINPKTGSPNRLCVDHNHITGKVRGLLCDGCNMAIGRFEVDKSNELLISALEYVKDEVTS